MDDKTKLIEPLLEQAIDYSKTSIELIKLKALDKSSDVISSIVPHTVVFIFIGSFMLFLSLGLSFWLGEILGRIYFGFAAVAACYGIIAIVLHFFMHKWLKKSLRNFLIKQVLN